MAEKITAEEMRKLRPGGRPKTYRFDCAADLEASRRNAYWVKQHCPREDGGVYSIKSSFRGQTVTVAVIEAEERNES